MPNGDPMESQNSSDPQNPTSKFQQVVVVVSLAPEIWLTSDEFALLKAKVIIYQAMSDLNENVS
jgi:hypothetical protein